MQQSPSSLFTPHPQPQPRPFLRSFDSGPECSFDHWIEVSWMVEHEEDELDGYLLEDSCFVASR
jgi:hypothetical protein